MKKIIIPLLLALMFTPINAQNREFYYQGQTIVIDISSTIERYYDEAMNGNWCCIPAVIECGAKEYGYPKAEFLYAESLLQGIDHPINYDEGMAWMKKAADANEKEAMSELGTYYLDENDLESAESYLVAAGRLQANYAYFNLGNLYLAKNNQELAEKYYLYAIQYGPKGQVESIHNLSIIYTNQGRIMDSVELLKIGAYNYNDPYSQRNLGIILYNFGERLDNNPSLQNKKEGKSLLQKASSAGDEEATQMLQQIGD